MQMYKVIGIKYLNEAFVGCHKPPASLVGVNLASAQLYYLDKCTCTAVFGVRTVVHYPPFSCCKLSSAGKVRFS